MTQIITALGIFYVALGVLFFVKPQAIRSFIDFVRVGKRCYIGGVVRIIIGGLLLWATPQAAFPWVPGIIGVLAVVSGILTYVIGLQRVYAILNWWYGLDDNKLRIMAVVAGVFGVLLIYSA